MIEIEKTGKPAIPIVSGRFEEDAIASSRAFAMPDLQFVIVPRIYRNLAPDLCISQTEAVIDDIIEVLTVDQGHTRRERDTATPIERFEGEDRWDAILKMNEQWLLRDWGDSLILHPPTPEAVSELIAGTGLDRDDLVCDMPPGLRTRHRREDSHQRRHGRSQTRTDAGHNSRGQGPLRGRLARRQVPAHVHQPTRAMLVVNGPIARELGINPRSGLGPGRDNEVNITIGRAFSLCLRNLGYWYPGQMDMDTIGTTRKFVHCVAENEDMSPWQPFHVDQGFRADESTVSVFITDGELDVQDQGNTSAEGLLKTIAYGSTFGTRGLGASHGAERLIFMPPDVARPVGAEGFSKQETKQFIHFHANDSLGKMIQYMPIDDARVGAQWKWLEGLTEQERLDITVPVLESVDRWYIVVVGADRAKTLVMPTGEGASTVAIDQYRT